MDSKLWIVRNHRKISLVWSFICLFLCCSMLIGTTYAWFTKTVTSGDNRIKAGDLRVGLTYKTKSFRENDSGDSGWSEWTDAADSDDILNKNALYEPGYVSLTFFKVENLGDLSFKYQIALIKKSETESVNVLGEKLRISDHLTFDFVVLTDRTVITRNDVLQNKTEKFTRSNALALNTQTNTGFALQHTVDAVMNKKDECAVVALIITMPSQIGNTALYDAIKSSAPELTLDFRLVATQYSYEQDTFDPYYDEKAVYQPDWTAFQYIRGSLNKGLTCYNDNGDAVVTVSGSGLSGEYTLVVSECSLPIGFTAQSGEVYRSYNISLLDSSGSTAENFQYRVRMFVGKGLNDVKLYHNGTVSDEDADVSLTGYDPDTGFVTFTTTKFSIFTASGKNSAARIGSNYYPSAAAAFDAVHNGSEKTAAIVLLAKEETVTDTLNIKSGENITLDLNGCTLKSEGTQMFFNQGSFTVADSAPNGSGVVSDGGRIVLNAENISTSSTSLLIANKGVLNLDSGRIDVRAVLASDVYCFAINNYGDGNININGADINVEAVSAAVKAHQVVVINSSSSGSVSMKAGSLTVRTDNNQAWGFGINSGTVDLKGGKIKALSTENDAYGIKISGETSGTAAGLSVEATANNGNAYGIYNKSSGSLSLNNNTVSALSETGNSYALYNISGDGVCSVNDGHYTSQFNAVYNSSGSLNIDKGTFEIVPGWKDADVIKASGKAVNIKNASLIGNMTASDKKLYGVHSINSGSTALSLKIENTNIDLTAENMAIGVSSQNSDIDSIKGCNIKVRTNSSWSEGINLEPNGGDIKCIKNCTIDVSSKDFIGVGISNQSSIGNIIVSSGNNITAASQPGKLAHAVSDHGSRAGTIVNESNVIIENVSQKGTCTWSGV